ncbi:MAG TPA: carboxypeptidase regulatory-like domain-containing protein [Candidatus Angelobacter sp.]
MNTKLRYLAVLAGVLGLMLIFSVAASSQGITTGSISGTVYDPQKAVVPGAKVTAVQSETGSSFTTKTTGEGYFLIANLPIGTYTLTIEATQFSSRKVSNVDVNSGQNHNIGGQELKIGVSSESISVEASAPLIETVSAQIGGTFDTQAVSQLPNAGVGFDNLALYVPGVANSGSTNFSNTNGAAIANNGLRGRSNNFQIDGQANNDNSVAGPTLFLSNPDVIGEVQIVSNNFGAEYGRNSGTIVNYVTKSGTNAFHGSGFEFNTGNWSFSHQNGQKNPLLGFCPSGVAVGSPTPFATKCNAAVIPRFVENRFGGTFGGPVVKDKVWFFASYQNDRQRADSSATSSSLTPTPAGISTLAAAFPGNNAVTALQQFGPYGIKVGNPTPAGTIQNIAVSNGTTSVLVPFSFVNRTVNTPFDDTQISGRGDWQISNKDRFFVRYLYQDSNNAVGSGIISSGAFVAVPAHDEQYGFDYTRDWSAHVVQQTRVGYSKAAFTFAGGEAFPQCSIANVTSCPPNIAFSDATNAYTTFGLATNLPQDRQVHNTQYQSNVTAVFGHHNLKFGGEFDHQSSPNHFLPSINGGYTFISAGTTNAFSQFIQGKGSSLSLTNGPFNFDFRENDTAFYGQDDWRVKSNLTLNIGLRWEWDQQAINLLHDISVKNVASGFWAAGLPASVTEIPKIPEDLNNFGPNLGFAWTPRILQKLTGHEQTVIRGGYRIAYDPAYYNIFLNVATSAPVVNSGTISNVGLPSDLTGKGVQTAFLPLIPTGQNPGARNQTRVDPNFVNPYVEQWSFSIERQLSSKISFETRYVGNHGVGNFQTINGNPLICSAFNAGGTCTAGLDVQAPSLIPSGVAPCTPAQAAAAGNPNAAGRVNCNFTNLRVRNNGAWSKYNGLQTEFKMRTFHGVTANVAYTWSKATDNVSEIFSSTGGVTTPIAQNPFDPNRGESGVTAQSFPHVVSTYLIYEVPWMKNQQGFLGRVLGGWQLSGTHRFQTGAPITPSQNTNNGDPYCDGGFNNALIGATLDSCRPLVSNPNAPFDTSGRYLNATQLINVSTCQSTALVGTAACPVINPSDVHFVVNNTFAINALCGGNPFACAASRNGFRSMARNQLDLAVAKNFKLNERFGVQLRADLFNALNYQFLGVPGLNVNSRNINGVNTAGAAPGTFGETWANTGTNRSMILNAHVTF